MYIYEVPAELKCNSYSKIRVRKKCIASSLCHIHQYVHAPFQGYALLG